MLVLQPFSFTKSLPPGAVHGQKDRSGSLNPMLFGQHQALSTVRQRREIGCRNLYSHQPCNTAHQPLGLAQRQFVDRAQAQAGRDREIRKLQRTTRSRPAQRSLFIQHFVSDPVGQIAPPQQAIVVFRPVRHSILLIKIFLAEGRVELVRQQ